MIEIKKINYKDTWQLRHIVMWPEKDFEYIKVRGDEEAIHFGLFLNKQLTSCISLFVDGQEAQFRKFATLAEYQGQGLGSKLLKYLIKQSKEMGINRLWCNARNEKLDFYKKFGLAATDNTFEKGGKIYTILEIYL